MGKPAVFLDRDGTINIDHNYVHTIDDFHFIEGVIEACLELKRMGFLLVVVTNQSGIGRGVYSEAQFITLTEWMDWSFSDREIELDGIYYCPHSPENESCDCRKPQPGMLLTAAHDLDIDLGRSYMVGDKLSDILAGKAAGVKRTVLVCSGHPLTAEAEQAADWILESVADLPAKIQTCDRSVWAD